MQGDREVPECNTTSNLAGYAGRWVACAGGRVVGQGGTPQEAARAARASRYKEKLQFFFVPHPSKLNIPILLEKIANLIPAEVSTYLVGGAVRDLLLGRQVHDMDFTMSGNVMKSARKVANDLGAAFFPLDEERKTARLILTHPNSERQIFDFAALRGPDLESDLRARDFTINAIAVDIRTPQELLDPLGGARDLQNKLLRACSQTSLSKDPLRILRAVRLAASYHLHIVPETRSLLREAAPLLSQVSSERVRDELFRILDGPQPASVMRALEMLGVFGYVFPEIENLKGVVQSPPHIYNVWEHTLAVVKQLEAVLKSLHHEYQQEASANVSLGLVSVQLGRFREQIKEHFDTALNPERSLRALLFLASLYHDIGKPLTRQVDKKGRVRFLNHDQEGALIAAQRGQSLHLSNLEVNRLATIVRNHLRPILLAQSDQLPSRKAIYRFFRDSGPAGVDICLLALADVLGTHGASLSSDVWTRQVEVVRVLLEAWWEHNEEIISPAPILNGRDVMESGGLEPGPEVGRLLETLREAQATGQVHTRQEAIDFIRELLKNDY
jgi:putative nucleotidyltransferase with HDIG domain